MAIRDTDSTVDIGEIGQQTAELKEEAGVTPSPVLTRMRRGFNRGVAAVLGGRAPVPSTSGSRAVLREQLHHVVESARGGASPATMRDELAQLQKDYDAAFGDFARALDEAKRQRHKFGDVVSPNAPAHLAETLRTIVEAKALLEAQGQPSPRPAPVPPSPRPQPRPKPGPKTPEQIRAEKGLEQLKKQLEKLQQQHQKDHQDVDPAVDKLKDLMRQMGKEKGMNGKQKPDPAAPQYAPQHQKRLSPSMDEKPKGGAEGKETPSTPFFIVTPPLQGYYRQSVMDSFDKGTIEWCEENFENGYPKVRVPRSHKIEGNIRGKIALPLPAGYLIDTTSIQSAHPIKVSYDEDHGVTYLESSTAQPFTVHFGKAPRAQNPAQAPAAYHTEDIITGNLSAETNAMLQRVRTLPLRQRAIAIAEYVQTLLEYSMDSSFNYIYKADPRQYFQKIEEHKKADCDVANGYFAALCRRAGIASRVVVGHRPDGSKNGRVEMDGNTAHAWAEIWDGREWQTIDATPPSSEPEEDGEPLDTNNPEESTDLKTNPPQKKTNPHKDAKRQEKSLEEAMKKNEDGALSKPEIDKLKADQQSLQKKQCDEMKDKLNEDAKMMKEEAAMLDKQGKPQDAQQLREKAEALEKAVKEMERDPANADKREAAKKALAEATEQAIERGLQDFARIRVKNMLERVKTLREAVPNDHDL